MLEIINKNKYNDPYGVVLFWEYSQSAPYSAGECNYVSAKNELLVIKGRPSKRWMYKLQDLLDYGLIELFFIWDEAHLRLEITGKPKRTLDKDK